MKNLELPPFLTIAKQFADAVEPAHFPERVLRYRNPRWPSKVGLDHLSSKEWVSHFGTFAPLPDNLPVPLAMRYHGHQFGTYNPQLGDGRGFLFAQLKDDAGRWLDLGTKGSGQTPYSRQGDGRLTLKGAVREILAANYLEALGVSTSKAFSVIETGEQLARGDEPSPTRSAVLVRLLHSHIRFGTFQRVAYLEDADAMTNLVNYCVDHFYPEARQANISQTACALLQCIAQATGKMIGQWMAAGFVHGVMNTDNFNLTGETFDFGPWRFLPTSDPNFTAAYFDENGLYRFGRQPLQGGWALQQLASALLLLSNADDLAQSLAIYEPTYQASFTDHTFHLLGLAPTQPPADTLKFIQAFYGWMTESGAGWAQTFFDWFGGGLSAQRAENSPQQALYKTPAFAPIRETLLHTPARAPDRLETNYFKAPSPVGLVVEDVEALWAPIAEQDDWSAFDAKLAHIEAARLALLP